MRKKSITRTPHEIDVLTSRSRNLIKGGRSYRDFPDLPDLPQVPTIKNDPVISVGVAITF